MSENEFLDDYLPSITQFYGKYFYDDLVVYNEVKNDNYEIVVGSKDYKISSYIWRVDYRCYRFEISFYYYQNEYPIKYESIKFFDDFITDFGRKAFYDYKINDSIILDIYDETKKL